MQIGIIVKIGSVDVDTAIENVQKLLEEDKGISNALKAAISILLILVKALANRLGLNSKNSSKPPSTDDKSKRQPKEKSNPPKNPRGGQNGHAGTTLTPIDSPDQIEIIEIDRSQLPPGNYKLVGYEKRQVINIFFSRVVTEYQAQILEDKLGNQFIAPFPDGVVRPVQYGSSVKAHAVYLSQFQLIPFERIQAQFVDQYNIPISTGSFYNFNRDAYVKLSEFEAVAKQALIHAELAHADETGINVDGKRAWLHSVSNDKWTLFYVHLKRGCEAMIAMGILPFFLGILCHDHWMPYFKYLCTHALCNAHHLRELIRAYEQDAQQWAEKMRKLLLDIKDDVEKNEGVLSKVDSDKWREKYRAILLEADIECPAPDEPKKKKRGRVKRTKSRNLLERLRDHEDDVLRFMDVIYVPFTNNQGERDIRMTKVQQKISGCFRSMEGAETFCRIRSYLLTCQKNSIGAAEALEILFNGKLPDFIQEKIKLVPTST
jgi:transposase